MAMKETIEEKLDSFIHVGWRDKALQNGHGIGKINIAGHAFHVPHRFQKLVIDTALKDSPQLFHFTADDIKNRRWVSISAKEGSLPQRVTTS